MLCGMPDMATTCATRAGDPMTLIMKDGTRPPASNLAALALLTIYTFSIPAKWATLHIGGLLIVLTLLLSSRSYWAMPATRAYAAYTLLWLLPIVGATLAQHALALDTATPWSVQLTFILRILGIGLGLLLMLDKGWISLRQLTCIILAGLAIHGLIGVGQWLLHPDTSLTAWRSIRIEGITSNPNPFGFFMALGILLCAALLRDAATSATHAVILWVCVAIFIFSLSMSGSRGAMLTTAAGMVILFPPSKPRRIAAYTVLFAGLIASSFTIDWQNINPEGDSTRVDALLFSLASIQQHPFSGWGIESYMRIPGHSGINSPHNMHVEIVLSSGVFALLGFLISTALTAYRLITTRTQLANIMLALLTACFVAGTVEYSVLTSNHFRSSWVIIVALACYALGKNDGSDTRGVTAPC